MNECLWVKEYLHDSKWLGCPGPAGALQRRWPHRARAGRAARRRRKLFYPSCTGRSWSSVAGSLSSMRHKAMCMCVQLLRGRRGRARRRSPTHVGSSAKRVRPGWNASLTGHMTSTLASSWGRCRQAWPLDLSIAVPALSWLPEPAETQGGTMSQKKWTASAFDPIGLYAYVSATREIDPVGTLQWNLMLPTSRASPGPNVTPPLQSPDAPTLGSPDPAARPRPIPDPCGTVDNVAVVILIQADSFSDVDAQLYIGVATQTPYVFLNLLPSESTSRHKTVRCDISASLI